MEPRKWQGKTGGGTIGQKSLLFLLGITSQYIVYFFLAFIVPFYMLFAYKRALPIYYYFRKRRHRSVLSSVIHVYWNHFVFGVMLIDRFSIYAGKSKKFKVKITGNEHFINAINSEKGLLIASSHIGNFEISGYLLSQNKKRINAVIYGGEGEEIKKNRQAIFDANNINPIPVVDGISHIFALSAAVSKGEIISMPCDRVFTGTKSLNCNFLGAEAEFPTGAFHIASKFDIPALAIFVMKEKPMLYHIYVKPLNTEIKSTEPTNVRAENMTRNFVSELETVINLYPNQWFNFYEFWKK